MFSPKGAINSVNASLTVFSPSNLTASNSSTVLTSELTIKAAILSTKEVNWSLAATKSVSQLTSTIAAFLLSSD